MAVINILLKDINQKFLAVNSAAHLLLEALIVFWLGHEPNHISHHYIIIDINSFFSFLTL